MPVNVGGNQNATDPTVSQLEKYHFGCQNLDRKAIDTFRKETLSKSNLSHTCPRYQVKTEDCLCLYSDKDCQGYNLSFQSVCIVCTMCTTLGLTSACNYANRVSGVNEYSLHAWITWPGVGCPTVPLVCVLPYYTWILYWNWIIRCMSLIISTPLLSSQSLSKGSI